MALYDAFMAVSLLAVWTWLRLSRLTPRQWWYRYWYLRSRHWRETRLRKLKAVGFKCQQCKTGGRLDVHHLTYARIGKEKLSDLQALCRSCHKAEHRKG